MRILAQIFQLGVRTLVRIFGAIISHKAPNHRIAHFHTIQTPNPDTFPNPKVRFWKEDERWGGNEEIHGRFLVSRRGKQGCQTQLLIGSFSLPPLYRLFGVLCVPCLKQLQLKKKTRIKIRSGGSSGQPIPLGAQSLQY